MVHAASRLASSNLVRKSHLRSHIVFGANTDVGKTLISAGLVRASLQEEDSESMVHYIKPLQCGGSDEEFVRKHVGSSKRLKPHTLFSWDTAASPHYASRVENIPKSDEEVMDALLKTLSHVPESSDVHATTVWIETAGGVLSPSSSSPDNNALHHARGDEIDTPNSTWGWSTQGDLYKPLAPYSPVVLVGDGRLGGISATLSAMESLLVRGYHVSGIMFLEAGYDNRSALREYARRKAEDSPTNTLRLDPTILIMSLPSPPPLPEPLFDWYGSSEVRETLEEFNLHLHSSWLASDTDEQLD